MTGQLGLIRTLRGLTPAFGCFTDDQFDEARYEEQLENNPALAIAACCYWIRKLQARFFADDYASAVGAAAQAERLLWTTPAHIEVPEYHFYGALARAAHCAAAPAEERPQHLAALAAHGKQLAEWVEHCPENFGSRAALVAAEIARLEGRELEAERFYEEAIRLAREHGFIQNEGIAHELAARFYGARGFETIAHAYLRNARYCYLRWGADGKVRQLEQSHPQLREESVPRRPTTTIGTPIEQLDLATVVKMSQAVSGEIVLEKLIDTLMLIAVEHAGAERGLLILPRGDALRIEAEATTARDRVEVRLRQAGATPSELPETVLHYVLRTQESVVLDDASAPNQFSTDVYIRQKHARSVLCLPLVKQASLIGVLYLENHLTPHVFTPARIAVLQLLASQAAISLENARLYTDRQQENTERKRAEEALRRSEAYLAEAQRLSLTGSFGWSVSSSELFWSEETFCIFAHDPATKPTLELIRQRTHPEERVLVQQLIDRASQDEKDWELEHRLLLPDGSVKYVHVVAHAVRDDSGNLEYVGAVMDVTATKRSQQALESAFQEMQALKDQHRLVIDSMPGLVWSTLPDGSADFFNQRWREYTGLSLEEALGWGWRAAFHPEDRALLDGWNASVAAGEPFEAEARMRRADGEYRWFLIRAVPLHDEQGNIVKWYGTSTDIEDRKQAEEAVRQAQAELAHVTRVMTMGELTASIAHEINQPLAAMVTNGNACLRWLTRATPNLEEAREAVERIIRDGKRAGEVIARIRALVRKTGTEKERLDLNEAIQEVVDLAQSEVRKNRVALRMELAADLPRVVGDRVQLQQVLLNLVMNGVETLAAVADRPRELLIRSRQYESDQVLVTVQDSGMGIEREHLDKIFAPFYTTKVHGMGMGLSISRSIVENHGGRLWAVPHDGPGATFQFTLLRYH